MKRSFFVTCMIILLALLSGACARSHIRRAEDLKKNKSYEEALAHYFKALKANPRSINLKIDIDQLLKEASTYYFYSGREQEKAGHKETAVLFYRKALEFDPGNNEASRALAVLMESGKEKESLEAIKKETDINIGLPGIFKNPERIDLGFKNKTGLKKIFAVLGQAGKVNILFSPGFRDSKVTISLVQTTFYEALESMCLIFNCKYYVLDSNNIIITRATPGNEKKFKKLLIKNLYFSNIEAQEAKQILESQFKPEKMILNNRTNSLIVTDSPENIFFIEKVARFIDKRKGEVEIEVEIIEVDKTKLDEFGAGLTFYNMGMEVEGVSAGKRLNDLYYLGSDDIKVTLPNVVWKFFSSITDSKILAQPKVRGLDREKIDIKLGEKRPIPRTTFVPVSSGGLNQQPITSYDMTDVGISIVVTPTIHHNREVTLELKFELTYVTNSGSTFVPPTLGSRKVSTVLRLRDGETGIIAGLRRGRSTGSSDGIPFLNRLPIIKNIFSSRNKTDERTDILLSITPRVLRMPAITRSDMEAYFIGTGEKRDFRKWKKESKSSGKKTKNKGSAPPTGKPSKKKNKSEV
ncbi:MAG: hypothetical protein KAW12_06875 [Candidatus Aminicenantes bacterium]|nr:hypothetical protein [Candidatus Aminicenantes bacterium]